MPLVLNQQALKRSVASDYGSQTLLRIGQLPTTCPSELDKW